MPQISVVGTGGDYTTMAGWESGESGSDYGVGNPAIAEITGSVSKENITGTWVRGFTIRAKAGEEVFTGAGTAIVTGAGWFVGCSTASVETRIEDIKTPFLSLNLAGNSSPGTVLDCWIVGGLNSGANIWLIDSSLLTGFTRGTDATSSATLTCNNVTAIDAASGNFCFVRATCTNCFAIGGAGTGFVVSVGDYNASDDTSSPGANSLDNRTTADLVAYVGGDYRTASGSALATAGSTGGVIGYSLETSSGVTGTGTLVADDPVGTGTGSKTSTGSSTLVASDPAGTGLGDRTSTGTGNLVATDPVGTGAGAKTSISTGSLVAIDPVGTGSGTKTSTGSGGTTAVDPVSTGVGDKTILGTSTGVATDPIGTGTGTSGGVEPPSGSTGTGVLVATNPIGTGLGTKTSSGTGVLVASNPTFTALGYRTIIGTGDGVAGDPVGTGTDQVVDDGFLEGVVALTPSLSIAGIASTSGLAGTVSTKAALLGTVSFND